MNQEHGAGKKKALIVTTVSGFVPQFEMNNVHIMQEMGYEVHYATNYNMISYGTDNHRLDGTGIICHQVDFHRSPFDFAGNKKALKQLENIIENDKYALIHCHTPMGAALARIATKEYKNKHKSDMPKVIYTAHGFHFFKGASLINWLLFFSAEKYLAKYTDILITINAEDYSRAEVFCKKKKTQVYLIPGVGIDVAFFRGDNLADGERQKIRENTRKRLGIKTDERVLISVGELIPRKNHQLIIDTIANNKSITDIKGLIHTSDVSLNMEEQQNMRYFICGQGRLMESLQQRIDRLGLQNKVNLLGYQEDIRSVLYASDVFIFPSKQEGLPVALAEAIAAGVPSIASDIRGNRDLIMKADSIGEFDISNVDGKMREIYRNLEA